MREQLLSIEQRGAAAAAENPSMSSGAASGEGRDDTARRERLQRVLSRLNRLHGNATSSGSYGETAPNHNSLYDWSPPAIAQSDDAGEEAELDSIRRELRRQLPNHHPEVLRVIAESVRAEMQRTGSAPSSRSFGAQHDSGSGRTEQSLRSQAILQAVRRHPRFSARSREYMQRYVADRAERERTERSGSGAAAMGGSNTTEARERISPSSERHAWRRSMYESGIHGDESRTRLRRSMLADPPSNSSEVPSDHLKRAVVYLGNLRRAQTYEDSLGYAVDARFVTKEFFGEKHDDFVLDVHSLAPICPTSMLARGSKFKGCQRANPELNPPSQSRRRRWERGNGGWDGYHASSSQEYLPRLTLDDPTRPSSQSIPPHAQRSLGNKYSTPDQWPVDVTVHDVDWEKMTLYATMEAQDVPSHAPFTLDTRPRPAYRRPSTPDSLPDLLDENGNVYREASRVDTPPQLPPLSSLLNGDTKRDPVPLKTITTYLEGEILDFRTHTFLTENFKSTPSNDATYWRKLEPFCDLSDEEIVSCLLSRRYLNVLNEKYILMRWKERCFVDDPKATSSAQLESESREVGSEGCGLTISGFYYVCLRRSDGHIEGLYCDPNSSPYQHLVLDRSAKESWWWGWEFK